MIFHFYITGVGNLFNNDGCNEHTNTFLGMNIDNIRLDLFICEASHKIYLCDSLLKG